jgi:hypothetical protein
MANLVFYLDDGSTFTHTLEGETTTIGRHPDSVVVLEFPSVSGHHSSIEQREDGYYVLDHKSSNGTRVNGAEIEESKLQDGDRVGFGDVQSVFYEGDAPEVVEMPAPDVVVDVPPPAPPATYRPTPVRRSPVRRSPARPGYPSDTDSGCMTAVLVIGLFLVAFCAGLFLRHSKETGGNLFSDLFNKLNGSIPKIKIEKTIEKDKP